MNPTVLTIAAVAASLLVGFIFGCLYIYKDAQRVTDELNQANRRLLNDNRELRERLRKEYRS